MIYKGKERKTDIICYILIISIIAGLFTYFIPKPAFAYNQKKGIVQVDDALNVRTGPGTNYAKLTNGGSNVQLKNGNSVDIIGEEYASDGAKWYKINFSYNSSALTGYVHSNYIYVEQDIDYTQDADFEAYLTKQGFPETYKDSLRRLHAKYPKWVFVADKLDYDWNEVVENEAITGRSLIAMSSISSWKSTETDAYNWDTGKWYGFDGGSWAAASKELVAYALDPRNFLDERYIFQFELLSYQSSYQNISGLQSMIARTFLNGTISDDNGGSMSYAQAIMDAAAISGVSPFCLASSIIQEQGTAGSSHNISGTLAGHEGYYNYYNWGAYASGGNSLTVNGLIYAAKTDSFSLRPWNTRYKSIVGGAKLFGKNYINIGQDTIYYKKFDFVGEPYTHQYMTHIIAARNEGLSASNGYSDEMKSSISIVFKIPVFKNMPNETCPLPTKDGSPNNLLSALSVSAGGLTPTFQRFTESYDVTVENSVSSINVNATAVDSRATVDGTGDYALDVGNNEIKIKVTAQNGDIRTYRIHVNRKAGSGGTNPPQPTEPPTEKPTQKPTEKPTQKPTEPPTQKPTEPPAPLTPSYSVNKISANENSGLITGISEKMSVQTLQSYISVKNGSLQVTDKNGAGKSGIVGTGDKVRILNSSGAVFREFTVVLYGDVNGDGEISIKDAYLMRRHILGETRLSGIYQTAANVSKSNGGITIKDAYIIKRHILGESKISQ